MSTIIRPTQEEQQQRWYADHYRRCHSDRPENQNARRHYAQQQHDAANANYRIAWRQNSGYFAQWKDGDQWTTVGPPRPQNHAAAILDAKLNAQQARTHCNIHPLIANLTEGRPEYDLDLTKPYPGW